MGYGDFIILSNLNFPFDSIARQIRTGKLLRMENVTSAQAAEAILDLMPLHPYIKDAAIRIGVKGSKELPVVQQEVQAVIDAAEGKSWPLGPISHDDFLEKLNRLTVLSKRASADFTDALHSPRFHSSREINIPRVVYGLQGCGLWSRCTERCDPRSLTFSVMACDLKHPFRQLRLPARELKHALIHQFHCL